jgi:group I intron endonuclease
MKYLVYKHTSPSGKSYIGITNNYSVRSRRHRTSNACPAFASAVRKYGWDNITHEILLDGLSLDEANEAEERLIAEHNTLYPNGYNLTTGGNARQQCEAVKAMMSAVHKGKTLSEEHKAALRAAGSDPVNCKKRYDAQKLTYKWFRLVDPAGNVYNIQGLRSFCLQHGLDPSSCVKVAQGRYKHHHGWICHYLTDPPDSQNQ